MIPKSLTATVHVRFNPKEVEGKSGGPTDIEMMARILDQASEMSPELQNILVKFAESLMKIGKVG